MPDMSCHKTYFLARVSSILDHFLLDMTLIPIGDTTKVVWFQVFNCCMHACAFALFNVVIGVVMQ